MFNVKIKIRRLLNSLDLDKYYQRRDCEQYSKSSSCRLDTLYNANAGCI